jgi:hypothetical protein
MHASCHATERVPPAMARRQAKKAAHRQAEKAAHTLNNVVTDAVFHAPMFALNADAERNTCEPSHPRSTPTARARMRRRRMRERPIAHAHTRARTDAARARVCGGRASAIRSSV